MAGEQSTIETATQALSFLKGVGWLNKLKEQSNKIEVNKFRELLKPAGIGIGDCMDERPSLTSDKITGYADYFTTRNLETPKPAMVGGAAGWVTYFILTGQSVDQAVKSTKQLYQQMSWGDMEVHIDDEHGEVTDLEQLRERKKGCGFLRVINDVVRITQQLLKEGNFITDKNISLQGDDIFTQLVAAGSKVVALTGHHKTDNYEARVVVNSVNGMTLNRDRIYDTSPAFLWDAWATTNQQVLNAFNLLANTNLTSDQFLKLQTTVHLATGLMLNALNIGSNGNLVMIQQ